MMKKKCKICEASIEPFMSFGQMPLANAFVRPEHLGKEYFFELAPGFCNVCKTVQLIEQPDPEKMFHGAYAFFSGTSQAMARHFESMADNLCTFVQQKPDPFVVELGSNDGIMLKHFANRNMRHLGIEPSSNVARVAQERGVHTLNAFFNAETAAQVHKNHGSADVISAANVMCHIADVHAVGHGVQTLLAQDGILVFEDPYLGDVISQTAYDQFYDAHVYIFSLHAVQNIWERFGLALFHVEPQSSHGGSMRYYLCRKGVYAVRDSVTHHLKNEQVLGLDHARVFKDFKNACELNRQETRNFLINLHRSGKRIAGYAAAAKSTTVLNYCNIGPDIIDYIADVTPIKQETVSPGMHIPIYGMQHFYDNSPDYAVIFAWNHANEIMEKEKEFVEKGGRWIVLRPHVHQVAA